MISDRPESAVMILNSRILYCDTIHLGLRLYCKDHYFLDACSEAVCGVGRGEAEEFGEVCAGKSLVALHIL